MKAGIYTEAEISEKQYHAETGHGDGMYITRSMVSCMDRYGPQGYWLRHVVRSPYAQVSQNDGMRLGCLIEDMMLGADLSRYVERPATCINARGQEVAWNRRSGQRVSCSDETTVAWEKRQADEGKTILDAGEMERCEFMLSMLGRSKWGANVMRSLQRDDLERQVVCRWQCQETGLWFQTRIDCIIRGFAMMDLKSTGQHPDKFGESVYNYGYDIQAVMYPMIWRELTGESLRMIFPLIHTTFPYSCNVHAIPSEDLSEAGARYMRAVQNIASKSWNEQQEGLVMSRKPAWAWYKDQGDENE